MMLEEMVQELRKVAKGHMMRSGLAGEAADAIAALVDKNKYLEEKLEQMAGQ